MKTFLDWILEKLISDKALKLFVLGTILGVLALIAVSVLHTQKLLILVEANSTRITHIEALREAEIEFQIHNQALKKEAAAKSGATVNPSSQKRWKTVCFNFLNKNAAILNKFTFDGSRTIRESCTILVRD